MEIVARRFGEHAVWLRSFAAQLEAMPRGLRLRPNVATVANESVAQLLERAEDHGAAILAWDPELESIVKAELDETLARAMDAFGSGASPPDLAEMWQRIGQRVQETVRTRCAAEGQRPYRTRATSPSEQAYKAEKYAALAEAIEVELDR